MWVLGLWKPASREIAAPLAAVFQAGMLAHVHHTVFASLCQRSQSVDFICGFPH